jgi:hypothetical protein
MISLLDATTDANLFAPWFKRRLGGKPESEKSGTEMPRLHGVADQRHFLRRVDVI